MRRIISILDFRASTSLPITLSMIQHVEYKVLSRTFSSNSNGLLPQANRFRKHSRRKLKERSKYMYLHVSDSWERIPVTSNITTVTQVYYQR